MSIKRIIYFFLIMPFLITAVVVGSARILKKAPPLTVVEGNWVKDPYLPYKFKPGSVSHIKTDEYDVEYKHNDLGFRDSDHTPDKPKDVFRILALGDSFTYGIGVRFSETYLYLLENMLNEQIDKSKQFEIIKAGIPRYFPESERLLLEHYGLQFSPDLVLVAFTPNDVIETVIGINSIKVTEDGMLRTRYADRLGYLGTWLYIHSDLARIFLAKYTLGKLNEETPVFWNDIYKKDGRHEKEWQKVETEYLKIVNIATNSNAKVIFIHIPLKGSWSEIDIDYSGRRINNWAKELNLGFIDTLQAIKRNGGQASLYFKEDSHTNSLGHKVIAKEIFTYVTDVLD